MITSVVEYKGDLRSECTHVRSGQVIITDAPLDNHGKGEAFSPTDLAATSLATCMITVMNIAANGRNIKLMECGLKSQKLWQRIHGGLLK